MKIFSSASSRPVSCWGARRRTSRLPSGRKTICWSRWFLAVDVHAVDHLADVFLEADVVLLHLREFFVEVVDEGPALTHVEIDGLATDDFGLTVVDGHLGVVAFEVGALSCAGRGLGLEDADVHGVGLDRFDEALGDEGDDVGLVGELERSGPGRV